MFETIRALLNQEILKVNAYYGEYFQGNIVYKVSTKDLDTLSLDYEENRGTVVASSDTHIYLFQVHDDFETVLSHGRVIFDVEGHKRGGWTEGQNESLFEHRTTS